jgi:soluble lytic murein transglycosylase-like protein
MLFKNVGRAAFPLLKLSATLILFITVLAASKSAFAPAVAGPFETAMPTTGDPVIDSLIVEISAKHGVDPKLVYHVMDQESRFKTDARSPKNAQGLMQIIPATAERFDVADPLDPRQNIDGGVRYLRWLLKEFDGDVRLALAGYNAGEGAVKRFGNKVPRYKETQNYVRRILEAYGRSHHPVLSPRKARSVFGLAPAGTG